MQSGRARAIARRDDERDDIAREVAPLLLHVEHEADHSVADQLVTAVQSDGLGVEGLEPTRAALERGQVGVLVLAADAPLDEATRNEVIRLAATSAADVEVVTQHAVLSQLGGVGALLRYKHEPFTLPMDEISELPSGATGQM